MLIPAMKCWCSKLFERNVQGNEQYWEREMVVSTFQPDRSTMFSSAAVQQRRVAENEVAVDADGDCGRTDTCQSYAARGVVYGVLISAPLWIIIGGTVYLAYRFMG